MHRIGAAMLMATLTLPTTVAAQHQHDDDHDHGPLHFTHPMVTESPSPDTKARLDFLSYQFGPSGSQVKGSFIRTELEYAFTQAISVALTLPYERRADPLSASGFGNAELSLKAVTFAQEERGLLFGGGLSLSLPTGSDANAIGSAHVMELEPFAHAAFMRGATELVGFLKYSTLTRLRAGEANEHELTFDLSALQHFGKRTQGLLELETSHADGEQKTSIAPGIEIVPFRIPLMLGASVVVGLSSNMRDTRQFLLSAFYHF